MTKPCQLSMFWLCCFVANFYTGKFQYNDHLATGIFLLFLVHKAKLIKARLQTTTEKKRTISLKTSKQTPWKVKFNTREI